MPTILTHAVVPLAAAALLGPNRIPAPLALGGAVLAMLPDLDVIAFRLGIAYEAAWGHRGATHSLAIAAVLAGLALALSRRWRNRAAALFLFASAASHGLLDCLTDGGKGVALYWPLFEDRLFAPWRPIRVSPIGAGFFTARGTETLLSEMRWVWLPSAAAAASGLALRRRKTA